MSATNLRLNPWNPAHWLILLRWFAREPAKLKEYITDLDAEGQRKLQRVAMLVASLLSFFPLACACSLLGLLPWPDYISNFGITAQWLATHWYILPCGYHRSMRCRYFGGPTYQQCWPSMDSWPIAAPCFGDDTSAAVPCSCHRPDHWVGFFGPTCFRPLLSSGSVCVRHFHSDRASVYLWLPAADQFGN